jgi:glutaredoxin 3
MAKVLVYSKENCPYCVKAKQLLNSLGIDFTEIKVDQDQERLAEMIKLTQRRTVPQIIINNQAIGGCDDLYALHQAGTLKPLIN